MIALLLTLGVPVLAATDAEYAVFSVLVILIVCTILCILWQIIRKKQREPKKDKDSFITLQETSLI